MNDKYPAELNVDYPEQSDRLTTFFRLVLVIPIIIILSLLTNGDVYNNEVDDNSITWAASGIVVIPTILLLVFRRKYPKWWYDWNLALTKFSMRVFAYLFLLRDEYPSTDEEQGVHIEIPYPNVEKELNQWLPLVKWFLAIPHIIVLCFLYLVVIILTIIAWFAILFTGNYPRDLFDFVVGVARWTMRVSAYALLLTTDVYPPFSLK